MLEGKVPADYDSLCRRWSDDDAVEGWRELRLALGGRNGWWFLDPRALAGFDGGPMWCFGEQSQPQLCITPLGTGFEIYVADSDQEVPVERIGEVVAWVDTHEPDDTLSPLLRQFLGDGPGRDRGRP